MTIYEYDTNPLHLTKTRFKHNMEATLALRVSVQLSSLQVALVLLLYFTLFAFVEYVLVSFEYDLPRLL